MAHMGRKGSPMTQKVKINEVFKDKSFKRLMSFLWVNAKGTMIITAICLICNAIGNVATSLFLQQLISRVIEPSIKAMDIDPYLTEMGIVVGITCLFYTLSLFASITYGQLLAKKGQDLLNKFRKSMFNKMQNLPIKYFDTNSHGDIMSHYTNDVDTLRQFITQSLPHLFSTSLTIIFSVGIMLYYSLYLTLLVAFCSMFLFILIGRIAKSSAKHFSMQQELTGKAEGYIEETMNGLKVVKVFTHEKTSIEEFSEINNNLAKASTHANYLGNILFPIVGNFGNFLSVLIAILGSILILFNVPNIGLISLSALQTGTLPLVDISIVVGFITITRSFTYNVNQVTQQISMVTLALAGAKRVFELLDEEDEEDNGDVILVNVIKDENNNLIETENRTRDYAWKKVNEDGTTSLIELKGDIVLNDVDFGYVQDKIVLHNVNIYANPGQKIAFVGATGAGKTTITNLINRFYEVQKGDVHYDGIEIKSIKKADLRNSLAVVLQDTNLFSDTVLENIRYGRLDATDEEVYEAAKIANAYDFISRLPNGFNTMLSPNGSNLSEGQRQLISIARAAIKDAPAMILDEATSSIDTRTEQLVQKGTDRLMENRTVFVIAHRLSTVQNSNAIMVLDHGRIIERGSHDSLIHDKGVYYQLYTGLFELE